MHTIDLARFYGDNSFPGFSERLNEIVDLLEDPPPPGRGRQAWFARFLDVPPQHTARWCADDNPVVGWRLKAVCSYLVVNLQLTVTAEQLQVWLLIGDTNIRREALLGCASVTGVSALPKLRRSKLLEGWG